MITVDLKRLDLNDGARVLDIGCGSGRHLGAAAAHIPEVRLYGLDPCRTDLLEAHQRLQIHQGVGECRPDCWTLCEGDATQLPFQNDAFDLVILSEVLEHIPRDREAISEALRVLKPTGELVISVPRTWPEKICWWLDRGYGHSPGGHIRIYRPHNLIGKVQAAGGRLWHRHWAHGLHSPYWWGKCLKGSHRPPGPLLALYHRLLVWDMMEKPWLTRWVERLMNPLWGKSVVFYFKKRATLKTAMT